jgi:hypothetical protein
MARRSARVAEAPRRTYPGGDVNSSSESEFENEYVPDEEALRGPPPDADEFYGEAPVPMDAAAAAPPPPVGEPWIVVDDAAGASVQVVLVDSGVVGERRGTVDEMQEWPGEWVRLSGSNRWRMEHPGSDEELDTVLLLLADHDQRQAAIEADAVPPPPPPPPEASTIVDLTDPLGVVRSKLHGIRSEHEHIVANEDGPSACTLCYTNTRCVVMVPCGHSSTCASCLVKALEGSDICPFCRTGITSVHYFIV